MTQALAERETGSRSVGQEYVTFSLNDEEYAFDALNVREIIEFGNVTKVPHLPDFFKGVINLRGTIIPVVDLKQKFGMESGNYQKHTCVIVTEFSKGVMGVIVDAVSDVMYLADESISSTPSFGTKIRTDFIKGMGKVGDRLVLILDVDKVLTEEASIISEQLTVNSE
jgi:purine-binding chemotaxis protein CheW